MRLTIEKKVFVGFVLALIVLVVVAALSYFNAKRLLESEHLVSHSQEVLAELHSIDAGLRTVGGDQRDYMDSGQAAYLDAYNADKRAVFDYLQVLRTLTSDNPVQVQHSAELEQQIKQQLAQLDAFGSSYQQDVKPPPPGSGPGPGPDMALIDATQKTLGAMEDEERRLLLIRAAASESATISSTGTYLTLLALVFGLLLLSYVIIQRDITHRKQIERKLRETVRDLEQQYRELSLARGESGAVLEAASEGMALVSPEGRFLTANRRFAQLFACTLDEVVGHDLYTLQKVVERPWTDLVAFRKLVAGSVSDRARTFTAVVQQSWPQERELELYSTPVFATDSKHLGRLFVFRDVTQARQVDRMKSDFVALVSHELRTPLTSIKGFVDLLLEEEVDKLTTEQHEFLDIIQFNSDRLVALINDLLDISRIESGKVELKLEPLDLSKLISAAAISLRPQIASKQQQLTLDIAAALPTALGDKDRVTQIMINLLSNAYKYTPAGGQIIVTATVEQERIRIDISDTGIGLTAAEQLKLFEKFFRAKNRTTQEVGGTGLGLSITRSLVRMHGGEMVVLSTPGQGSTFSFTLPTILTANPSKAAVPLLPVGGLILVVDDEPDIVSLMRRYLERGGYRVLVARTAGEGLSLARSAQPDLITLDVLLPDADGFTLLEWLKSTPATAAIPVIMVSIMDDEGRGKLLGAVDYLTKPVQEQALNAQVTRILAGERNRVVLVADDDSSIRTLIGGHLRRAGYTVVEAADGNEAIAVAARERPALALLDIKMPGLDGIATLRALRANPVTRNMAVLVMTASPGLLESTRSTVESLGSTLLMSKPATAEEVAALIGGKLIAGSIA